ncbi:uncharacterized protein LOC142628488 [Castanea sativa]|uniref:uncharacterized protein LOC142628488 n=1 Tax=Castanea sativa TaxID=21020 RepID=UPI003F6536D7
MNRNLIHSFTKDEVEAALRTMEPLSAPGPDGMPPTFFQTYWLVVGDDVTSAVLNCLNNYSMPADINHTFITLIPKVKSPEKNSEYRFISLCNVIYKLVSQVLANRLHGLLPDIISKNQSAFQAGRIITDNILMAYETLHYMKHQLETAGLHTLIEKAARDGHIRGISLCKNGPRLTHLVFADDSLLFCRASLQECDHIHIILSEYEAASSQKLNRDKTTLLFSKATPPEMQESIINMLGVPEIKQYENDSLPTRVNLVRRKLLQVDTCPNCNLAPESASYALWSCPKLDVVWFPHFAKLIEATSSLSAFAEILHSAFQDPSSIEVFANIVSLIWMSRNRAAFGEACSNLGKIPEQARSLVHEFNHLRPVHAKIPRTA